MKRTYFDPARMTFRTQIKAGRAPRIQSRRFGLSGEGNDDGGTAYLTDAPDEDPERVALLKDIKEEYKKELDARKFTNQSDVEKVIKTDFETRFKEVDIDALKKYKGDKEAMDTAVRNMGVELEKLKNLRGEARAVRNAMAELIKNEDNFKLIETAFKSRKASDEVVFNIRVLNVPMTTDNTVDNSAVPDDILNSFSVAEFTKKRQPREWIFDIAARRTVGEVTKYKIWLDEGNIDGAFAVVAEGAVKPYISGGLVRNVAEAKKIAAKYVITEELQKFMSDILNTIEDLITDKLLRDYNDLLAVDLMAQAASYVGTIMDGKYTNPTDYHVIAAVSAQIATLNFQPTVLIIHPQDKYRIMMEQATDGHFFVQVPLIDPNGEMRMLGLKVRTSTKIPLGTGVIGEEGLWKIEDEAISIRVGYGIEVTKDGANVTSVTSDFDTNRMRMIVETWFIDWIATSNIGSFVEFDFEDVKAVLTAP